MVDEKHCVNDKRLLEIEILLKGLLEISEEHSKKFDMIDVLLRDVETYDEIRRAHFRAKDIKHHEVSKRERRTRNISLLAVIISIFSGALGIIFGFFGG